MTVATASCRPRRLPGVAGIEPQPVRAFFERVWLRLYAISEPPLSPLRTPAQDDLQESGGPAGSRLLPHAVAVAPVRPVATLPVRPER